MMLDACASFCASVSEMLGPQAAEYVLLAVGVALAWFKARRVEKAAQVGIAAAREDASKARLQLAEIKGSLRPAAASIPTPEVVILPAAVPSLDQTDPDDRKGGTL